jgi:6-phosphogluconolactonase
MFLQAEIVNVYFGTQGKGDNGIYHAKFDTKKGRLSNVKLSVTIDSPGFLAINPNKDILYAVAKGESVVVSYTIEKDGSLSFINKTPTNAESSAHIAVHPSGNLLITAQYKAGAVAVFPIDKTGSVQARSQLIKHEGGAKVIGRRQDSAHPHWTGFSPDGNYAFIPDLGLDQLVIYKVDHAKGRLLAHAKIDIAPGSAPRHMRFSNDARFIYLLNEISLTISTLAYDSKTGTVKLLNTTQTLSTEVKEKEVKNAASEILVHPNSKFMYSANRGNDSVTVYQVDAKSGKIKPLEVEAIRGSWPRSINLDPSGKWLLAAGQFSNTVAVFAIDAKSGELSLLNRNIITVPSPTCIVFSK